MKKVIKLALVGIGVGVLVLVLKGAAYAVTGSVALYSDALESIVNVATALAAFVAVRVSAKPPDSNHPYGHHKAEYLSAVLEGVLIVIAAVAILQKAYFNFSLIILEEAEKCFYIFQDVYYIKTCLCIYNIHFKFCFHIRYIKK